MGQKRLLVKAECRSRVTMDSGTWCNLMECLYITNPLANLEWIRVEVLGAPFTDDFVCTFLQPTSRLDEERGKLGATLIVNHCCIRYDSCSMRKTPNYHYAPPHAVCISSNHGREAGKHRLLFRKVRSC